MSKAAWRLLITDATDGPMNMAVDQAIMEAVAGGHVPPTLRFYAWQPTCLSLGYTQPISDVDRDRLAARGWGLVRRLTGGRAILHTDELTYSVTLPTRDPIVASGIVESYRRLSQALLNGLRRLGVNAGADRRVTGQPAVKGPVCFEVPSHYEITANGKKLIGSAQVRKSGTVLQHGSLPLWGDVTRICDALVFEDNSYRESVRERVHQRASTLESVLGQTPVWEQVATVFAESFRETFDLAFVTEDSLSPEEHVRAEDLRAQQYSTENWNSRF